MTEKTNQNLLYHLVANTGDLAALPTTVVDLLYLFKEEDAMPPAAVFMWTKVLNKIGDMANHAENVGDQFRLFVAG